MNFLGKIEAIVQRHNEVGQKLAHPENMSGNDFSNYSKEYASLSPIVEEYEQLKKAQKECDELKNMLDDPEEIDAEMKALTESEISSLEQIIATTMQNLKILLLPKDEDDEKNVILEIRAGTGGDEAALFAADLFRMYCRYAETKQWAVEIMNLNETGIGGYKEVVASIAGKGVFAQMKFESGVHRVQRIPQTESGGRIHTSAATVAVLPEVQDIDIKIEEKDLRIDTFRASGPGGQSVNTTDSAVRVTHLPTGIVVSQQDEKSQHKNRAKAMRVLRARLYEFERAQKMNERSAARKSQVGSGDRSERIRTYNYPQGRVTDHRIGLTLHKLDTILEGDLNEIIEALRTEQQVALLADIE